MTPKTCKKCGEHKFADDFYPSSGRSCKECIKEGVRRNRVRNAEYYREYDAKRFQDDPKVRGRHVRYQKTTAGKASMQKSRRKWLDNNSDKRAAHIIVGNAVRSGKLKKPSACSICFVEGGRIEGHHSDYAKPLEVTWCCRKCHAAIHREMETKFNREHNAL